MSNFNKDEKRQQANRFLEDFKTIVSHQGLYAPPRDKNHKTLIELGITQKLQQEIIIGLTADDYISGPLSDTKRSGFIWEFGTRIETAEIYIKLKIAEYTPVDTSELIRQAICISFHTAERTIDFPLE